MTNPPIDDGMRPVMLPSGGTYHVYDSEYQWFETRRDKYMKDNSFTNISDLQDLDRVLMTELLVWRWSIWLSQKLDYWGEAIDENTLQKAVKDHSAELRQLKKSMGLDKESRDKKRGEGSVHHYLEQLRERASHFGYMRNDQSAKLQELGQQLIALVTLHENCTDQERIEQHVTQGELYTWIRDVFIKEFEEIDEKFRQTNQKYWIRQQ